MTKSHYFAAIRTQLQIVRFCSRAKILGKVSAFSKLFSKVQSLA